MKELRKVIPRADTRLFRKDVVAGHSVAKLSEGAGSSHVASNLK